MRKTLLFACLSLTLAACDTLQAGLGVSVGSGGTTVSPSITGTSGNASISIGG